MIDFDSFDRAHETRRKMLWNEAKATISNLKTEVKNLKAELDYSVFRRRELMDNSNKWQMAYEECKELLIDARREIADLQSEIDANRN